MNKNKFQIISLAIIALLFATVTLFFNNKLNRQFNEIKELNKTIELKEQEKIKYTFDVKYPVPDDYSVKKNYFLLSDIDKIKKDYKKDDNGVQLIKWNINGEDTEVHHPVSIAQFGLKTMALYKQTNDEEWRKIALAQADYFVKNISANNQWMYPFDFVVAKETLKAPWSSAMGTGQALSLLSRAYLETGDNKYLEVCEKSLLPLYQDVKDGGLSADFFGHVWYEEYPTKTPNYTLNGFMFTLIGLHEYYEVSNSTSALELYENGIKTLEYALPFFDSDGITFYHLGHLFNNGYPVTINVGYHAIHVLELGVLKQWVDSEIIDYYYYNWNNYMEIS